MKKILSILIAMAIAIVFVSCKNENNEVKKLPSRIISHEATPFNSELFYDEQNRLVGIIRESRGFIDTLNIVYNSEGLPIRLNGMHWNDVDITHLNNGRKVIIHLTHSDTFWLNNNGQFTRWHQGFDGGVFRSRFSYNSNGNITRWRWRTGYRELDYDQRFRYSDVRAVFRHVNTPEWLLFWLANESVIYPFATRGYLPNRGTERNIFELDTDNYVTRWSFSDGSEFEFEFQYILATIPY